MLITIDDPLSIWTNVIDKESGKSFSEQEIYLTEWDTTKKVGKYHNGKELENEEQNFVRYDITLPNAKTIIRIPESYPCNLDLIKKLISNDKDVELIIDR